MIYAIIPFQRSDKEELRNKVAGLEIPVYTDEAPNAYFVSYNGTTRELGEAIGFSNGESGTGIVIPVANYYGYAAKDLWEWINIHEHDYVVGGPRI